MKQVLQTLVFNLLLVDDTWPNLEALINIISRIKIPNTYINIEHNNDGDKALETFTKKNCKKHYSNIDMIISD